MAGPFRPQLVVPRGAWGTVEFAVRLNDSMPAREFLDELGEDAAVFLALFVEMAAAGRTNSPNRFSKELGRINGFKAQIKNRQIRFPCFQKGNRWILTHGFYKPGAQKGKGRWPKKEFDRAATIMHEHLSRDTSQSQRNEN